MKETIIKGTKNSRSIIGAASIPVAWEQARAQLIQSGWPIDLGPLNAAGLIQKGDDLNKANLLKDATVALYGLTSAAVPDDVLAKARTLIAAAQTAADGRAQVAVGSYVGTGVPGTEANPPTLTFPFSPAIVFVSYKDFNTGRSASVDGGVYGYIYQLWMRVKDSVDRLRVHVFSSNAFNLDVTFNGNRVSRLAYNTANVLVGNTYSTFAEMNQANITYSYIAIG